MALKLATDQIQSFTPTAEKNSDKPTTVYFKSMTKRMYDQYADDMIEVKRGKVVTKKDYATEALLRKTLAPSENGTIIANACDLTGLVFDIKDMQTAVSYILGIQDLESANEIVSVLRGSSSLEEIEGKN